MAGSASNWFKVQTGPAKGQSLYLPKSRQTILAGIAPKGMPPRQATEHFLSNPTHAQYQYAVRDGTVRPKGSAALGPDANGKTYPTGSKAATDRSARAKAATAEQAIASAQNKIAAIHATVTREGRASTSSYETQLISKHELEIANSQKVVALNSEPPGPRSPTEAANLAAVRQHVGKRNLDTIEAIPDKVGPRGEVKSWRLVDTHFGEEHKRGLADHQVDMATHDLETALQLR
jgi:hypothetical protein